MQSVIHRVEIALQDLRQGKMVILTDHPERENEGDLIMPAESMTPDAMNFIIRNTSGIVCVAMTKDHVQRLNLPLMVPQEENTSRNSTPFTISIDAKQGIATGVSVQDRTTTIRALMQDDVCADDFVKPGHIFPLQAKEDGVLERQGHTEGAVDLAKLAGFKPVTVLCELMNPDGSMMKGIHQLNEFAKQHQLSLLSIDDLIKYRISKETIIKEQASSTVPLDPYGSFDITVIKEKITDNEYVVLSKPNSNLHLPLLVRIHSSCLTGDLFASRRCDCNKQLHYSLQRISKEGGMLFYLLGQEGRGIGLLNKIRAYALQDQGYDTVEANEKLGLPVDSRSYFTVANLLHNLNINHIRLLTNNPDKIEDLKKFGIHKIEQIAMPAFEEEHNQFYLQTKITKLNHTMNVSSTHDLAMGEE